MDNKNDTNIKEVPTLTATQQDTPITKTFQSPHFISKWKNQHAGSTLSLIPIGGVGDVTRNMYLYEYKDQIFIVDCGIGFADETMLGVDLLLPDISYLLKTQKKIVGMALSHGHEDHIGALPFVLPQLPDFPIYATPLTAALANEKLREFGINKQVQTVPFESNREIVRGDFSLSFIRITHSVPDSSHIFIKTPVGNFYHGSDFKFDLTPADGKKADFQKITKLASLGVTCLLSDCLGAEREGLTPSELSLSVNFERELGECKGKFIVTTFASNISRLNQAIAAGAKFNRRVCFIGRSLIKAKEIAQKLGYMQLQDGQEVEMNELKNYKDDTLLLIVAGSQGQENSAMSRIAAGDHKDVTLTPDDVVVFSSDPIPGNETLVNALIDTIAKTGARAVYSTHTAAYHVSGHGSSQDLMLLMSLVKGKKLLPIGGGFKQMVAYRNLAKRFGYADEDVLLPEDGQELIFSQGKVTFGRKIKVNNVYVDQLSGEEVESFVLRDRQKLSMEGIVVIVVEMDTATSAIAEKPDIIARGFSPKEAGQIKQRLGKVMHGSLTGKQGRITNLPYLRKRIMDIAEQQIFRMLRRRPLVLPVIIEV